MTNDQIQSMQADQKEYLHDATTSLELDPTDETVIGDDFALVYDSHRHAIAVAKLACNRFNDTLLEDCEDRVGPPPLFFEPSVVTDGKKHYAIMKLEDLS